MRVTLISTYHYPVALGMRYLSSFLKQAGHQVEMLFMDAPRRGQDDLPAALLDDFVDHCRESQLVGMSLMTNSFFRARALTEGLRRAGVRAPIVWGGTHPTVAPEECAPIADYVCIGEGEKAIVDFIREMEAGRDPALTPGFALLRDGRLNRRPTYPLSDDLDEYPYPDYDLAGHWVVHKGRLVEARPELLRGTLRRYRMSSTRGCPFPCTFCNNAAQLEIYRQAGDARLWVRKRSVESILGEIESVRARYPHIEAINLIDDLFLVRKEDEIERFVEAYARRVNLPIELDAFPTTISEAKIRLLARLPIELISMGIQSGSQSTLKEIYRRPTKLETVAEAMRIIDRYHLPAEYHYIVRNPFESEQQMIETLRFAARYHRPAKLRIFPLMLYPGSHLYHLARERGIIGERHDPAYHGEYTGRALIGGATYLEIWLRIILGLRNLRVPSPLANGLVTLALLRPVRWCLDRSWFAPVSYAVWYVGRSMWRNLVQRPFVRPWQRLRTRRHARPPVEPGSMPSGRRQEEEGGMGKRQGRALPVVR